MAPFYPLQAKEKGVSVFYVGFVLGSNAVAYIIGSMFASNFLHFDWYGRERAMVIGMLLITIQQAGLYAISYEEDGNIFLLLSIVFQLVGGLGSGNNSVASMAMVIADAEKNEREQHIGLIETSTGVGFLLGPLWGSLMY